MFYLVGIIITFYLAIILLSKRGKTKADRILTCWLFVMGLHLTLFYLFATKNNFAVPFILGLELPLPLLHGPFLYFYTAALTGQNSLKKWGLHFVPVIISYLLFFKFFLLSTEDKIQVYENKGKEYELMLGINTWLIIISGIAYVSLALWLLNKHKKAIRNQFSYTKNVDLTWLRYLIYGIAFIWLTVIFGSDQSTFITVVFFVFFLGYFGIRQVGIFSQQNETAQFDLEEYREQNVLRPQLARAMANNAAELSQAKAAPGSPEPRKEKYIKSGLSEESAKSIHSTLTQKMAEKKYYTNPEITLADLARELDIHPNNLSQVINSFEGKNFYDYINIKRVEEFKQSVARGENEKFTLLSLALNCGFNSKTSFNRNFKNVTGLSPSEWLNTEATRH